MTKTVAILGTRGYPSYYGGFETAVRRLAPHLADKGWDVVVYGRSGAVKNDEHGRDPRVLSRCTPGLATKSLSTLSHGLSASTDAVRRKPDVALVMNVANGFWLPMLRARGIPTLVNVDGIEWEREKWGPVAKQMFFAGARLTARYATRLVFDALEVGRRWGDTFGRTGAYIPYGGDILQQELPLEPGLAHRRYALMVARFVPENTVSEFLQAAEVIGRQHDVVIVGSSGFHGEFDTRVATLAANNPRITWLGHLSSDRRLHSLWQHAGAYFHGHSVGGTNPALVQAMAAGAPVVARDNAYNREVLADSGTFVAPEPFEIAQGVLRLLSSPDEQARLSSAAQFRAGDSYSWEGVCSRYEEELAELGQRGCRGRVKSEDVVRRPAAVGVPDARTVQLVHESHFSKDGHFIDGLGGTLDGEPVPDLGAPRYVWSR